MFNGLKKIKKFLKENNGGTIIKLLLYGILGLGILVWILVSLVKN